MPLLRGLSMWNNPDVLAKLGKAMGGVFDFGALEGAEEGEEGEEEEVRGAAGAGCGFGRTGDGARRAKPGYAAARKPRSSASTAGGVHVCDGRMTRPRTRPCTARRRQVRCCGLVWEAGRTGAAARRGVCRRLAA